MSERERYFPALRLQQPAPSASSSPPAPQSTPWGGYTPEHTSGASAPTCRCPQFRYFHTFTPSRSTPRPTRCARRVCCKARGPSTAATPRNLRQSRQSPPPRRSLANSSHIRSTSSRPQRRRAGCPECPERPPVQILCPQLGVLGLVARRLGKNIRDLNVAVLGLGCSSDTWCVPGTHLGKAVSRFFLVWEFSKSIGVLPQRMPPVGFERPRSRCPAANLNLFTTCSFRFE